MDQKELEYHKFDVEKRIKEGISNGINNQELIALNAELENLNKEIEKIKQDNIIKFCAKVQNYRISTSIGHSLMVIIPKEFREKIALKEGEYLLLIAKKVNFDEVAEMLMP